MAISESWAAEAVMEGWSREEVGREGSKGAAEWEVEGLLEEVGAGVLAVDHWRRV